MAGKTEPESDHCMGRLLVDGQSIGGLRRSAGPTFNIPNLKALTRKSKHAESHCMAKYSNKCSERSENGADRLMDGSIHGCMNEMSQWNARVSNRFWEEKSQCSQRPRSEISLRKPVEVWRKAWTLVPAQYTTLLVLTPHLELKENMGRPITLREEHINLFDSNDIVYKNCFWVVLYGVWRRMGLDDNHSKKGPPRLHISTL